MCVHKVFKDITPTLRANSKFGLYYTPWYVVCGMWYVVCGMWYMVCGMWYVVCGMWPMVYIPHTTYHIPHTTYHIPYTTYHIPHTTYHIPHTMVYGMVYGVWSWPVMSCNACLCFLSNFIEIFLYENIILAPFSIFCCKEKNRNYHCWISKGT